MAFSFLRRSRFDLLVLGAGRGGTSLVGSLLDSHPQLTVALEHAAEECLVRPGHREKTGPGKGFSREKRLRCFRQECRRAARKAGTAHWGNKLTTEQLDVLYPASWEELWSPGSPLLSPAPYTDFHQELGQRLLKPLRVIYLSRDGRSCIHSKMQRSPASYVQALYRWKAALPWWHWLRDNHPQWHWLRYEDLLRQPETELRRLCQFLELPYAPAMLGGASSNRIHEDYRQTGLDSSKAAVPPEAQAYAADIREELDVWGY